MRTDYVLYSVAVICFVVAAAFAASAVPGYTPAEALGISVIVIFALLGIISATVGYSVKPKMVITTSQPAPVEADTQPPTPEPEEPSSEPYTPPPPAPTIPLSTPIEEAAPEPEPAPPEPSPPVVTVATTTPSASTETETLEVAEQPVKVEEEAPKERPARRRRKKA